MEDKKVNLFVVGAMRAGTTSFMELLSGHPEIYVSPIKEPHFFVDALPEAIFEPQPDNFLEHYFKKKFPKPIHRAHVRSVDDYISLFKLATDQRYLAEGSVSYLHAPNTAAKLKRYNPDAKIIILTRDPLERAFSHYKMDVGLFRENKSFEEVLKKEMKSYYKNELPWYSYLNMSFYKTPIMEYRENFGGNVLVVSLEDIVTDPKNTSNLISGFLDVEAFKINMLPRRNKGKDVRFKNSFALLKVLKRNQILSSLIPFIGKRMAKQIFLSDYKSTIQISQSLRKNLVSIFNEEI